MDNHIHNSHTITLDEVVAMDEYEKDNCVECYSS